MKKVIFFIPLILMLFLIIPTPIFAETSAGTWIEVLSKSIPFFGNAYYQASNVIIQVQPDLSIGQSNKLDKEILNVSSGFDYVYYITSWRKDQTLTMPYKLFIDCTDMPNSFFYEISWVDSSFEVERTNFTKADCVVRGSTNTIWYEGVFTGEMSCFETGVCSTDVTVVADITDSGEYASFPSDGFIMSILDFGGIAQRVEYIEQPILTSFVGLENSFNSIATLVVSITILILQFVELTFIVLIFLAIPFLLVVGLKLIMKKIKDMLAGEEYR